VTLEENYYFPSGEGNLLLGKEEKLASSWKYLRKRRKSFLYTFLSSTAFFS